MFVNSLLCPHKKKSIWFKSGDLSGHWILRFTNNTAVNFLLKIFSGLVMYRTAILLKLNPIKVNLSSLSVYGDRRQRSATLWNIIYDALLRMDLPDWYHTYRICRLHSHNPSKNRRSLSIKQDCSE